MAGTGSEPSGLAASCRVEPDDRRLHGCSRLLAQTMKRHGVSAERGLIDFRPHHREFGDEELSVGSGTKTVFAAHAHF